MWNLRRKRKVMAEEVESRKPIANKERNIDHQLDLEKIDRESGIVAASGNKLDKHVQKQQKQPGNTKKTGNYCKEKKIMNFQSFYIKHFVLLNFLQLGC